MGRRGPPPKSQAERQLAGTDRKDRSPPAGTGLEYPRQMSFPKPPETLNADGKALWIQVGGQLVKAGVMMQPDAYALEQLCYAWQRFRQKARANEEISPSENASLRNLFVEFGLTPSARKRIAATLLAGKRAGQGGEVPGPAEARGGRFARYRRSPAS